MSFRRPYPRRAFWRRRHDAAPRPLWLRLFDYLLTAAIFGLALLFIARMDAVRTRTLAGEARVHDGDTITLDGQRMRLKGIDAPEYNQTCQAQGRDYPCGREARKALADLTRGRAVSCDGWEFDKYDRLLVRCRAGDVDVNDRMVRSGWAISYGDYRGAEQEAKASQRGIWRGRFEAPRDWRDGRHSEGIEPPHDLVGSMINWLKQLVWPAGAS